MNPPKTSPGIIVFALWLLVFSASSQIMIITPILPQIGEELGIGESRLGTLVSAYSIMVGLFAIVAGPVSDKIGRRQILLLGTAIMTGALLLHHFVVGYYSFLAVRVAAGAGGGILSGSAVSYIGDFFPYNRRGWATGWVMSGMAFGQIAGIPLGIVLAGAYGFQVPFYLFAVAMGATFVLIWFRVPQPDVQRDEGPLTVASAVRNYRAMLAKSEIAAAAVAYFTMFIGRLVLRGLPLRLAGGILRRELHCDRQPVRCRRNRKRPHGPASRKAVGSHRPETHHHPVVHRPLHRHAPHDRTRQGVLGRLCTLFCHDGARCDAPQPVLGVIDRTRER